MPKHSVFTIEVCAWPEGDKKLWSRGKEERPQRELVIRYDGIHYSWDKE